VIVASAFGSVHDFFHSSAWYVIRNLAIFLVFVFWVAMAYWVYKDAKHRIADRMIVWVVTAIGVVPFFGPLIYMLFRPPEYLADVRERDARIDLRNHVMVPERFSKRCADERLVVDHEHATARERRGQWRARLSFTTNFGGRQHDAK